jgi:DNA-binding transcriptional LysR family regulator
VGEILSEVDAAEEAAHTQAGAMSGKIRVLSLPGMPTHLVAPAIAEFRRQHPKVTVELSSDVLASRDIEGHDIALLMDHVPVPGDAVIRHVLDSHSILCASPDYIRRHGAPGTPQALQDHALVRLVLPGVASHAFKLLDETDGTRQHVVDVLPVLTCNDHEAALRSTLEGAGISSQAMQVAAPLIRTGQLQRVLSPWICERCTLVATYAGHRHMPARMRAFLDHLLQHARQTTADIDKPRGSP